MRTFREAQEYVVVQELVKADGFNEGDPAELAHILFEVAHRQGREDIVEALDVLVK